MFVARSIAADHRDLIHDVSFDFHGRRMATCSSDQSVKVSGEPPGLVPGCVAAPGVRGLPGCGWGRARAQPGARSAGGPGAVSGRGAGGFSTRYPLCSCVR